MIFVTSKIHITFIIYRSMRYAQIIPVVCIVLTD